MLFKCRKCGKEYKQHDICPDCKSVLERVCPICGFGVDSCICFKTIPQTKGHKPR